MAKHQHIPHPGEHVAHRALDESEGGAKEGVVKEYVGDEESGIVIIEDEDGREGFDSRELVTLKGPGGGPVILHPRHLRVIFSSRQNFLAFLLVLVFIVGLISLSVRQHLSTGTTVLIGLAVVVADVFLIYKLLQRRLS